MNQLPLLHHNLEISHNFRSVLLRKSQTSNLILPFKFPILNIQILDEFLFVALSNGQLFHVPFAKFSVLSPTLSLNFDNNQGNPLAPNWVYNISENFVSYQNSNKSLVYYQTTQSGKCISHVIPNKSRVIKSSNGLFQVEDSNIYKFQIKNRSLIRIKICSSHSAIKSISGFWILNEESELFNINDLKNVQKYPNPTSFPIDEILQVGTFSSNSSTDNSKRNFFLLLINSKSIVVCNSTLKVEKIIDFIDFYQTFHVENTFRLQTCSKNNLYCSIDGGPFVPCNISEIPSNPPLFHPKLSKFPEKYILSLDTTEKQLVSQYLQCSGWQEYFLSPPKYIWSLRDTWECKFDLPISLEAFSIVLSFSTPTSSFSQSGTIVKNSKTFSAFLGKILQHPEDLVTMSVNLIPNTIQNSTFLEPLDCLCSGATCEYPSPQYVSWTSQKYSIIPVWQFFFFLPQKMIPFSLVSLTSKSPIQHAQATSALLNQQIVQNKSWLDFSNILSFPRCFCPPKISIRFQVSFSPIFSVQVRSDKPCSSLDFLAKMIINSLEKLITLKFFLSCSKIELDE